ncbi:serine/threonine protein kinase [Aeoliella sp. SH292]|uniref:serine/threonine protein kinase n=1 Tax=Aeoliella sp. SH292 TaxID=3454464 RepID=UPI003F9BE1E0
MGIGNFFKSMLEGGKVDVQKRYEYLREAVSGTMSEFYLARDRQTDQLVGLKILDIDKTTALEARFKGLDKPSEGKIASSFSHPLIVTTLQYGTTTNNQQFIVMEFLDGPGLNSLIVGKSKLLDGNRLTLVRQMAEAIKVVHDAGYIHRDICPRNFVCSKDATSLKLIDFGLTVPAEKSYMQPGIRTGTPNYMAPEVVRRKPTDKRLDIFAMGVSMYEIFAFDLPWTRGSDGLAAMAHGGTKPKPISAHYPKIDPKLDAAILKCIENEPDDRFGSVDDFLKAIKGLKSEDAA